MVETCFVCGDATTDRDRVVLVRGSVHQPHCSDACLQQSVRIQRRASTAARRGWLLRTLVVSVVLTTGLTFWRRHHAPPPELISLTWPESLPEPEAPPPGPIFFGPAWPPSDDDWMAMFARANWIYPLPGPTRRWPTPDARIFGPEPSAGRPSQCRTKGRCAVDLGGELWGEHVYAALDGVVERVQGGGGDERGGQYIRLSHLGGMVFTQYFHLAAMPRQIVRGARVRAGDVIALLGDTGIKGARRHLHFALSVRPSSAFGETYWDPKPLMIDWPLHSPPHGTVAGLAHSDRPRDTSRRRRFR